MKNTPDLSPKCRTLTEGCEANGLSGRDGLDGMVAICLSSVDRRVIISADDVAHRTGGKRQDGAGRVCGV